MMRERQTSNNGLHSAGLDMDDSVCSRVCDPYPYVTTTEYENVLIDSVFVTAGLGGGAGVNT